MNYQKYEMVKKLIDQGLTAPRIADKLEMSPTTIHKWFRETGDKEYKKKMTENGKRVLRKAKKYAYSWGTAY